MNEKILELIGTFPRGGGYSWDASKPTSGVTQDLTYKGKRILSQDTATYCCGITFEAWFLAIGAAIDVPVSEMQKIQRLWYCAAGNRKGCQEALLAVKMGTPVSLDEAQAGDFLQLWRQAGSGHSVIYLSHDTGAGTLTYFSTQRETNGAGERTERLETLTDLYFVRALNEAVDPGQT